MSTTVEPPVNISVPAADRILELHAWPQFKAMLEHTADSTPGPRSIAVSRDDQSRPSEPTSLIVAEIDELDSDAPGMANESTQWRWDRWTSEIFPLDILKHFCVMVIPSGEPESNGR